MIFAQKNHHSFQKCFAPTQVHCGEWVPTLRRAALGPRERRDGHDSHGTPQASLLSANGAQCRGVGKRRPKHQMLSCVEASSYNKDCVCYTNKRKVHHASLDTMHLAFPLARQKDKRPLISAAARDRGIFRAMEYFTATFQRRALARGPHEPIVSTINGEKRMPLSSQFF